MKIFSTKSNEIILEKTPHFSSNQGKSTVTLTKYSAGEILIKSQATENGLVYISDNFANQWKAYVDGKQTEILRANYSFMAIPVTKGKHTILLQYKDSKETLGFLIGGISIVGIFVGIFFAKKNKYL